MTSNTFSYQHTQRGTLMLAALLGISVFVAGLALTTLPELWIPFPVFLICAWLFHSLTIEIGERELRWRFGPGLLRKQVALAEIRSATPVRTHLLEGWGIHWGRRYGWLYNVSGFAAVAVTLHNGKRFALGTDEPQALAGQLAEVIQRNPAAAFKA